jgi:hypothetical protein
MTKEEKQFREFFQNPSVQFDMKRLNEAGVSAVQRATSIMALRRMFNTYVTMNIEGRQRYSANDSFQHHVDEVINEMQVG